MHNDGEQDGPGVVSNRTMEAVVALVLLGLSAVVIFDSNRGVQLAPPSVLDCRPPRVRNQLKAVMFWKPIS